MEKRKRKENTKNTNVIFYDGNDLEELKELAFRNNTDVSSVVSNLTREFLLLFRTKSPQKTLFNFNEEEDAGISFDIDNQELKQLLLSQTDEEFKKFNSRLEEILGIANQIYKIRN